jgi:hypothetical protein
VEGRAGKSSTFWWTKVLILIPALHMLPAASRTRRFNNTSTFQATGILPRYIRLYSEDVCQLDHQLAVVTRTVEEFNEDQSWHFLYNTFRHRMELKEDEELGPEAFGLEGCSTYPVCADFVHTLD